MQPATPGSSRLKPSRTRRSIAIRLAFEARDALAAEVIALREKCERLERELHNANVVADMRQSEADMLHDALAAATGNRADISVCLTKDGQVFVAAKADQESEPSEPAQASPCHTLLDLVNVHLAQRGEIAKVNFDGTYRTEGLEHGDIGYCKESLSDLAREVGVSEQCIAECEAQRKA